MKKGFRTRKIVTVALCMLLLMQTVVISFRGITVSAETAAAVGDSVTANIGADGLAGMTGWKHYYHASNYYYRTSNLFEQASDEFHWKSEFDSGLNSYVLKRTNNYNIQDVPGWTDWPQDIYAQWSQLSQITYTEKTFKNFEIDTKIVYNENGHNDLPLYIIFGNNDTSYGVLANGNDNVPDTIGMALAVFSGGGVALVDQYGKSDVWTDYTATNPQGIANGTAFDLKLVVYNGIATVYINETQTAQFTLPRSSEGYVAMGGTRAVGSGFASFLVKEVASATPTFEFNADFSSNSAMTAQGWKAYNSSKDATSQSYVGSETLAAADLTSRWTNWSSASFNWFAINNVSDTTLNNWYEPWYGYTQVVCENKSFKNFEMELSYIYGSTARDDNTTPLYIGFGNKDVTKSVFNTDGDGGYAIAINYTGNVALVKNGVIGAYSTANASITDDSPTAMKIVVDGGKVAVYNSSGVKLLEETLDSDYAGGKVFFAASRSNWTGMDKMKITKLTDTVKVPNLTADFSSNSAMTAQGWKAYNSSKDATSQSYVGSETLTAADLGSRWANWSASYSFNWVAINTAIDSTLNNWYEPWYGYSQIIYENDTFKNFEMNISYIYGSPADDGDKTPLYIGFGNKDVTKSVFNTDGDGGYAIAINGTGNVALVKNGVIGTYSTANASITDDSPTAMKIVVDGGKVVVYNSSGVKLLEESLGTGYAGGKVFFAAPRSNWTGMDEMEIYKDGFTADFSSISALEAQGFKFHYREDYYQHSGCDTEIMPIGTFWDATDGALVRKDHYITYNYYEPWTPTAHMVYQRETFKNFEMVVDYTYSTHSMANNKTPLHVGFGKTSLTNGMFNTSGLGGYAILIKNDGNIALVKNGAIGAYTTNAAIAQGTKTTMKVSVNGGVAKVYINDTEAMTFNLDADYDGGYVYFGAGKAKNSSFSRFEVCEVEATGGTGGGSEGGSTTPSGDPVINPGTLDPVDPNATLWADFSSISALETQGFKFHYREDYYQEGVCETEIEDTADFWYTSNGAFVRKDTYRDHYYWEPWTPTAHMVYEKSTFKNFEIVADYTYSSESRTGDKSPLHIGFGKTELTNGMFNRTGVGGYAILIKDDGNIALVKDGVIGDFTTNAALPKDTKTTIKLVVNNGTATVYQNDTQVKEFRLPEEYTGGYVYFGAGKAKASYFTKFAVYNRDTGAPTDPAMREYKVNFANYQPAGWQSTWLEDCTAEGDVGSKLISSYFGFSWLADSGGLYRTDSGYVESETGIPVSTDVANESYNIAQMTYKSRQFNNFEMTVKYTYLSGGDARIMIGFGRKELDRFASHANGGTVLAFNNSANVQALVAGAPYTGLTNSAPGSAQKNSLVTVKLTVKNWIATVNVNGVDIAAYLLPDDYKGYISVGATNARGSLIHSLELKPLADNAAGAVKPTEAPSFDVDWSEIIGNEPDNGVPPTVSGIPFLPSPSAPNSQEDALISFYSGAIQGKFFTDDEVLLLPWEGITVEDLLNAMHLADGVTVNFMLPDGTLLDSNTVLIDGVLMQVSKGEEIVATYTIAVGEYKSDKNNGQAGTLDGTNILPTNKPSSEPEETPKTGDSSKVLTASVILIISLLGAAFALLNSRRMKKGEVQ